MRNCIGRSLFWLWHYVANIVSFEFFLTTRARRANGGDIILARSILSALLVFLAALVVEIVIPNGHVSCSALWEKIPSRLPWFGAIWFATYVGLYARFASQWMYLANLYNQIKATEIKTLTDLANKKLTPSSAKEVMQKLAEWKAGYVEDAENLHLATKKSIAPIIWFWLNEAAVKEAYLAATPGGMCRYELLIDAVNKTITQLGGVKKYQPTTTI